MGLRICPKFLWYKIPLSFGHPPFTKGEKLDTKGFVSWDGLTKILVIESKFSIVFIHSHFPHKNLTFYSKTILYLYVHIIHKLSTKCILFASLCKSCPKNKSSVQNKIQTGYPNSNDFQITMGKHSWLL